MLNKLCYVHNQELSYGNHGGHGDGQEMTKCSTLDQGRGRWKQARRQRYSIGISISTVIECMVGFRIDSH